LELYPSSYSDVFARLGLKPGDRVTAIDGVALKSSKEAIGELRRLSEGASVNVTIERGGKAQMLSLDGSLVRAGASRG
jgi:type II secretory pathway component PulC